MATPDLPDPRDRSVDPTALGESLSAIRLCDAAALEGLQRSLRSDGQLSALVVFEHQGRLEIIDGFKRVRAARALGWQDIRVRVLAVDRPTALVLVAVQAGGRSLTELEEGWLVRSLHREHRLLQSTIATRLGRHPAWVCRRLMLVERIDEAVLCDVRLGLLTARAAVELSRLPRGNQSAAATMVVRRGLTVRQVGLLVDELCELSSEVDRSVRIAELTAGAPASGRRAARRVSRSDSDAMAADIRTVRNTTARLSARLYRAPLAALGPEIAGLIAQSLRGLRPVLATLLCTIDSVLTGQEDAA